MVDVAKAAGVGAITVSRVLSAPEKVAPETRAKVLSAIEALRYVPNLAAGTLKSRRSRIVAAVVPTLRNSIFADTVEAMSEVLRADGYELLLGNSGYSAEEEEALVATFLGRQPDAMILTGVQHTATTRRRLKAAGIPVVETWDETARPLDMVAGFSNVEAARRMTHALIERGYRGIAFAGVPPQSEWRSAQRQAGYAQAMEERGLSPTVIEVRNAGLAISNGAEALSRLVEQSPEADAVFFANDFLAFGGLIEAQRRGWPVPARIAVAGFGDFEIARETLPALSTVRVPGAAIGREAARLVLQRLAGETPPLRQIDLGFEIVLRESA
jgi:LacI family transcriptional regulator, gluconate utilization system Gnt-I transcriptional repressor